MERCKRYRITIGDVQFGPVVTHRGITFNFTEGTVTLKEEFVKKFELRCYNSISTWAEIRSLFSMGLYGMQVHNIHYCEVFNILRFLARNWNTPPKVVLALPSEVKKEWEEMKSLILSRTASSPVDISPTGPVIITDASLDGSGARIGAILVTRKSQLFFISEEVPLREKWRIAHYEAWALLRALEAWSVVTSNAMITILIDNTAVLGALNKGFSPNFLLNFLVKRIVRIVQRRRSQVWLWYVPSKLNPADPLTRDFQFTDEHRHVLAMVSRDVAASVGVEEYRARGYLYLE